jgi:hypothetical protein
MISLSVECKGATIGNPIGESSHSSLKVEWILRLVHVLGSVVSADNIGKLVCIIIVIIISITISIIFLLYNEKVENGCTPRTKMSFRVSYMQNKKVRTTIASFVIVVVVDDDDDDDVDDDDDDDNGENDSVLVVVSSFIVVAIQFLDQV